MASTAEVLCRLPQEPVTNLRIIKNTLTGHELRKIEYIRAGLIPTLTEYLSSLSEIDDDARDAIWSNAASIIAVLANSGPVFTQPILRSNLIALLFSQLRRGPDSKRLDLTILRCLLNVAENLPLASQRDWGPDQALARLLYTKDNVKQVVEAAAEQSPRLREVALALICKTCTTVRQRALLVESDLLAVIMAQMAPSLATNKISHMQYRRVNGEHTQCSYTDLALETIGLLIEDSQLAAKEFVHHEWFHAVSGDESRLSNIPHVPDSTILNAARRSNFPPLGLASSTTRKRSSATLHDPSAMVIEDSDEEDAGEESAILWLLQTARNSRGRKRIVAARLLGILKCHGVMHPVRARSLAALLVPILVDMIETKKNGSSQFATTSYTELVPSTLALLVRDNEHLQDAAVESKAIPKLAAALKANFETTQELATDLWWPQKFDHRLTEGEPASRLGPGGPSKQVRLNMQLREGLLQALASLAPTKDAYRKDICEQGALAQIILALEPFYSSTLQGMHGDSIALHGNSAQTLIAACGAVRALTRSATALRTKLVDADVAKSVLRLLQTAEPEVRIAATMVMANLAHDFSPMKPSIGEHAVIRKLCEQAHSANARLRHESLFALKALVSNSNNKLKRQVVDELGPNWIKQLIATDPHDVPPGEVIGLVPKDYRKGSMVRITDDAEMEDADMEVDPDDQEYARHTLQQDLDIQAELLAFLRNLTTGEQPLEIIDYLLDPIGQEDFLQILLDRLQMYKGRKSSSTFSPPIETVSNSLYVLAHLCAADQKYRKAICYNTGLMKQVVTHLTSSPLVRRAACWLLINLVYPSPTDGFDSTAQRARELQKIGVVSQLRRMEISDPCPDVVERVKTALDCFSKLLDRS